MEEKKEYAVCQLKEVGGSGVNGLIKIFQNEGGNIHIIGEVNGLSPGLHGMHIHQFGKEIFPK